MKEIDFAKYYAGVRAYGFVDDLFRYQRNEQLQQVVRNGPHLNHEIARACLHEAMAFLSAALSSMLAANHERSGGYKTWSQVTEYYAYYHAQVALLRLAGGGPSTAHIVGEDQDRLIWFWRTSDSIHEYQIGPWGSICGNLKMPRSRAKGGIHGQVAMLYTYMFRLWKDSPPHFDEERDHTLELLRKNPPFPYEYPIEIRTENNYFARNQIHELGYHEGARDARRLAEMGPQEWALDLETWWFSVTVWDIIRYGLTKLCEAGGKDSIRWFLEYVENHSAGTALKSEVTATLELLLST